MSMVFRKASVFAMVAALTLHPVVAQAQVAVGTTNKVVSKVMGVFQSNTRNLNLRDAVYSDESINTGANSATRLIFQDNTILSVGASSSITLDKFIFDADASKSQVALSMSKGVMRFVTGTLAKEKYSIRTPTAVIGVRGTTLVVAVAANGTTTVSVTAGSVTVTGGGATTTVNSGFTTSVSQGTPPTPPSASPPATPQLQAMNSALGPEPGVSTGSGDATTGGLGGLSTGALVGVAALAAAVAVAIAAASSDNNNTSTDTSSSTSTSTATN
ncbi:MAG: hypothetical protein HOH46_22760 [Rhodospirillaceae bacterium]|jgi:hypothetical protein|nr:hypothetical protein [Rhodospirillaceae bacterium]